MGCAPAPRQVRTASPDLTTVAKPYPSGVVILELVINEKGVPVSSCVLHAVRADFDKAAQLATLEWRFEPKLLDGKRVGIVMTVTVKAPGITHDGRQGCEDGPGRSMILLGGFIWALTYPLPEAWRDRDGFGVACSLLMARSISPGWVGRRVRCHVFGMLVLRS